ncbi:uncharacterized protein MONBRDRAFT_36348 [Monosiga brevicollis MX1]|uniref:Coilin n=1 Tax=Monosiga brevicollis TaxID=81824 RepID=A9UV44_MONBE|nr:uncharacterized protein MONBRDRAFT_36348 [Monosiga brevicollis MX1]EDQ91015.1 predicted protein [Monosiga brevicollis MX1]|eukprot:XP_001744312.1 hypothetical protein [Monosiga brevicollis MX1]
MAAPSTTHVRVRLDFVGIRLPPCIVPCELSSRATVKSFKKRIRRMTKRAFRERDVCLCLQGCALLDRLPLEGLLTDGSHLVVATKFIYEQLLGSVWSPAALMVAEGSKSLLQSDSAWGSPRGWPPARADTPSQRRTQGLRAAKRRAPSSRDSSESSLSSDSSASSDSEPETDQGRASTPAAALQCDPAPSGKSTSVAETSPAQKRVRHAAASDTPMSSQTPMTDAKATKKTRRGRRAGRKVKAKQQQQQQQQQELQELQEAQPQPQQELQSNKQEFQQPPAHQTTQEASAHKKLPQQQKQPSKASNPPRTRHADMTASSNVPTQLSESTARIASSHTAPAAAATTASVTRTPSEPALPTVATILAQYRWQPLIRPTQVDDILAFKELELGADCMPRISDTKVARVLQVDGSQVQLERLHSLPEDSGPNSALGKFLLSPATDTLDNDENASTAGDVRSWVETFNMDEVQCADIK